VRSYSIHIHDPTLKMILGAKIFFDDFSNGPPNSVHCRLCLLLHHSCLSPHPICSLVGCHLAMPLIMPPPLAAPLLSSGWFTRLCLRRLSSHCHISSCSTLHMVQPLLRPPCPLVGCHTLLQPAAVNLCRQPLPPLLPPPLPLPPPLTTLRHHPPPIIDRFCCHCPYIVAIVTDAAIV
jgi:hypothetical protein